MAFGTYAEHVCAELDAKYRASGGGREKGTYMAAFGHAVFLNMAAYAVAVAASASAEALEHLLDIDLGEAEGILVPLYGGAVQHLQRPL